MEFSGGDFIISEELSDFRKEKHGINLAIPEISKKRVMTDKKWLLIFVIAIILLLPLIVYTLSYSDYRRIFTDSDDCGNVCGFQNNQRLHLNCSGKNMTNKRFVRFVYDVNGEETATCVEKCNSDDTSFLFQCQGNEYSSNIERSRRSLNSRVIDKYDYINNDEIVSSAWMLLLTTAITIVLSFLVISLFRYATGILVWTILVVSLLISVATAASLWTAYGILKEKKNLAALSLPLIFTGLTIILLSLVIFLFRRIHLVILFYKEAAKALFDMPLIIIIPLLTFLAQTLILMIFITTAIFMNTSGSLIEVRPDVWFWKSNIIMDITEYYNILLTFWVIQFVAECQYMITSGAVSSWYFSRNKKNLILSPVKKSIYNVMRFHLGSIAIGSFVITSMYLIKIILNIIIEFVNFILCCESCPLNNLIKFMNVLSKNAYIEEAIHGQPIFKSGRRAADLLLRNAKNLIAVNTIGDLVLGMAQVLTIALSTAISYVMFSNLSEWYYPTIIAFTINIIVVVILFAVFEATIDTLFICFCEDRLLNDGISDPYFMSRGLMQFVEKSNEC